MNLSNLLVVKGPIPLEDLTSSQLSELQSALTMLGYSAGPVDGLLGPKTRNAWDEFKTDVVPGNPRLIGQESVQKLASMASELSLAKDHDFSTKEGTIKAIKAECRAQGLIYPQQQAYVLATVEWETAQTFKPVKEAYWMSEGWRQDHLRYFPYYGRGFVQLTWKSNYEKYSSILGVDMVSNPDLALNPDIALFILVHGFKTGAFTGRKITDYINDHKCDFVKARRCINGTDRANTIAGIARRYDTSV